MSIRVMKVAAFTSLVLATLCIGMRVQAEMSVVNSKHNLSATGPGAIRALVEDRICIFCHTPHNAAPFTPLWNKELKPKAYTLYESSTLSSHPSQPTGPTRLCLSCHDGTIALGEVLNPSDGIQMSMELSSAMRSHLGVDISDDHPVSFNYREAVFNTELAAEVPADLPTYGGGYVHCTTCHDPHDDTFGNFLIKSNQFSALCISCHDNVGGWDQSGHAISTRIWAGVDIPPDPKTVAEYGCLGCHAPHGAQGGQRLLQNMEEEKVCYNCHDGSAAAFDIKAQFEKISYHPVEQTTIGLTEQFHDPVENVQFLQGHVECVDCHDAHGTNDNSAEAPFASGMQALVKGKDLSGAVVDPVTYGYEVCFKCHGNTATSIPIVTRWMNENNTMVEFDPVNPSYHPVVEIGRNPDVQSLGSEYEPNLTTSSMMSCVDCHDSDESSALDYGGPSGPHGSIFRPILRQRYDTIDFQPESEAAYALCYRCHDRTKLLDDQGLYNVSSHRKHVVDYRAPCSACHDPHGVRSSGLGDHTHLINFDRAIVAPYGGNSEPVFYDYGTRSGSCVLVCHGAQHDGEMLGAYPGESLP